MSDYIPSDVLLNIITRLPIKTLVQWTSVCKSWHSLITDPSFIKIHLNRPTAANDSNNRDLMFVRSCSIDGDKVRYSLHHDNETFGEYMNLELPFNAWGNYVRIFDSCNGLICLANYGGPDMESHLFLWNPSIRKLLPLPIPTVCGPVEYTIGFGFDPVNDDYKVVRVAYLGSVQNLPEVDIFTLSMGVWRNISHLGLPYLLCKRSSQAYLNRAVHWIAFDTDNMGADGVGILIVCFDISDEVFREIRLPRSLANERHFPRFRIAIYQESLCVIHSHRFWDARNYEIWVMKEYGIVKSWTKQFNIESNILVRSITGFRRNGKILFGKVCSRRMLSYDPEAKEFKDLGIHECFTDAHAYTESLVLLGVKCSYQ